jgi:hypothetical protein
VSNAAARVGHIAFEARDYVDMQMANCLSGGPARVETDVVTIGFVEALNGVFDFVYSAAQVALKAIRRFKPVSQVSFWDN